MLSALDLGLFIIKRAQRHNINITHLKLHKLTYIVHGYYLATFGESIIDEVVEHFTYGPKFASLFQHFNDYGTETIAIPNNLKTALDDHLSCRMIVDSVLLTYGSMKPASLTNLTVQDNTPFSMALSNKSNIIDNNIIYSHYKKAISDHTSINGL